MAARGPYKPRTQARDAAPAAPVDPEVQRPASGCTDRPPRSTWGPRDMSQCGVTTVPGGKTQACDEPGRNTHG